MSGTLPFSVVLTDELSTSAARLGRSLGNGRSTGHQVLTLSPGNGGGWLPDGSVKSCEGTDCSAITDVSVGISI